MLPAVGEVDHSCCQGVHHAFTKLAKLVLVASPSKRQSAEFMRKVKDMLIRLRIAPRGDGDNACSVMLPNGSRIVALPGKDATVRGFSAVSLLMIDEAARVDDAMYRALRPMLAVGGGDLWLMSTPRGKRGFFYENYAYGGEDWFKLSLKATENARIPPKFLEEERREMGRMWFAQEYMCEFVDYGGAFFSRELIERAIDGSFGALDFGT